MTEPGSRDLSGKFTGILEITIDSLRTTTVGREGKEEMLGDLVAIATQDMTGKGCIYQGREDAHWEVIAFDPAARTLHVR